MHSNSEDNRAGREFQAGQRVLGLYRLRRCLGLGICGEELWTAEKETDGQRPVLLHFAPAFLRYNDAALSQARDAAQATLALRHPAILRVRDFVQSGSLAAIELESPGEDCRSLADVVRERRRSGREFTEEEVHPWLKDLLGGLVYAHQMEVPHGELRPCYVFFDAQGRVRLTGFQTARLFAGFAEAFSPESLRGGLERYREALAPELIEDRQAPPSRRVDVYCAGRLLRRLPWKKREDAREAVIEDCLQASPERRVKTVEELSRRLFSPTSPPSPRKKAAPKKAAAPQRERRRRSAGPFAALLLCALLLLAGGHLLLRLFWPKEKTHITDPPAAAQTPAPAPKPTEVRKARPVINDRILQQLYNDYIHLERDAHASHAEKQEQWENFLRVYTLPPEASAMHQSMRKEAEQRIAYWKKAIADPASGPLPLFEQEPGWVWRGNSLEAPLCWIPKGTFRMGSPSEEPGRQEDERMYWAMISRGFWMGRFEVSQKEWRAIMGSAFAEQRKKAGAQEAVYKAGDSLPMYFITRKEAEEFCLRLTARDRLDRRIPDHWEYRLPTEAEWEYACRADTETAFHTGDVLSNSQANFADRMEADALPAAQTKGAAANAWGLYHMHGNVMEWCQGGYGPYPIGSKGLPAVDPPGARGPAAAVVRGGNWQSSAMACRSAWRRGPLPNALAAPRKVDPKARLLGVGFRPVLVETRGLDWEDPVKLAP